MVRERSGRGEGRVEKLWNLVLFGLGAYSCFFFNVKTFKFIVLAETKKYFELQSRF